MTKASMEADGFIQAIVAKKLATPYQQQVIDHLAKTFEGKTPAPVATTVAAEVASLGKLPLAPFEQQEVIGKLNKAFGFSR